MSKNKLIIAGQGYANDLVIITDKTKLAESRLHEAQHVNAGTYSELEYTFNESYRELKNMLSNIQYEMTKAEKNIQERKADIILGVIPEMLEGQPKTANNADFRNAVMAKDEKYQEYLDYLNKLKALESHFSGKIDVMTQTCRYMKKQMDLIIKAGYIPPVKNTGEKL